MIKEIELKPLYSETHEQDFREDMVLSIYTIASKDLLEQLVSDRLNSNFKIIKTKIEETKQDSNLFSLCKLIFNKIIFHFNYHI